MEYYEKFDLLRQSLSDEVVLDELAQYLSSRDLEEFTDHCISAYDLEDIVYENVNEEFVDEVEPPLYTELSVKEIQRLCGPGCTTDDIEIAIECLGDYRDEEGNPLRLNDLKIRKPGIKSFNPRYEGTIQGLVPLKKREIKMKLGRDFIAQYFDDREKFNVILEAIIKVASGLPKSLSGF